MRCTVTQVYDITVIGNFAKESGGALLVFSQGFTVYGSSFFNNTARVAGGALMVGGWVWDAPWGRRGDTFGSTCYCCYSGSHGGRGEGEVTAAALSACSRASATSLQMQSFRDSPNGFARDIPMIALIMICTTKRIHLGRSHARLSP